MLLFCICAVSCKESKTERTSKLNDLIKIQIDYQKGMARFLSDDSAHNAVLFQKKKRSDQVVDSLQNEIKKIEAE